MKKYTKNNVTEYVKNKKYTLVIWIGRKKGMNSIIISSWIIKASKGAAWGWLTVKECMGKS